MSWGRRRGWGMTGGGRDVMAEEEGVGKEGWRGTNVMGEEEGVGKEGWGAGVLWEGGLI